MRPDGINFNPIQAAKVATGNLGPVTQASKKDVKTSATDRVSLSPASAFAGADLSDPLAALEAKTPTFGDIPGFDAFKNLDPAQLNGSTLAGLQGFAANA